MGSCDGVVASGSTDRARPDFHQREGSRIADDAIRLTAAGRPLPTAVRAVPSAAFILSLVAPGRTGRGCTLTT